MQTFLSYMGCKQTTIKSPSIVDTTLPPAPIYVKSALKNSRIDGKGKTEKLSASKRKKPTGNKSVNFDENVQVKVRTPTPTQTRQEQISSAKIVPKQISNDDNNIDNDDQVSVVSSQDDDNNNQQNKTSTVPSSASTLQRNQPNSFWYKNNSIGITSPINNIKEKNQPPPVNTNTYPTEDPDVPVGTRFRVRRKVQYSILPQSSSPVDRNQSSASPSFSPPVPIQRPLSNTSTVLLEHRVSSSNSRSSPQTAYYAFSRRPTDNKTSTEN